MGLFLNLRALALSEWFKRYAESLLKVTRQAAQDQGDNPTGWTPTTMPSLLDQARQRHAHTGLLLEYGLLDGCDHRWRYGDNNSDKAEAVKRLADYQPDLSLYKVAFNRWKQEMKNTCCWRGQVMQRLFLGLGERATYTLETAVTLDPTYGLPTIPGSTLKGIARAVARSRLHELIERRKSNPDDAHLRSKPKIWIS